MKNSVVNYLLNINLQKITIVIFCIVVFSVSRCQKDTEPEPEEVVDFCSCINIENIDKTIPIINKFLSLPPEQQQGNLIEWLKAFPCVLNVEYMGISSNTNEYVVFFNENEVMNHLLINIKKEEKLKVTGYQGYIRPNKDLFCSLAGAENVEKTISIVEELLNGSGWYKNDGLVSTEHSRFMYTQLERFTNWLNSCPCVYKVHLIPLSSSKYEIYISFSENEAIRVLSLFILTKQTFEVAEYREYYEQMFLNGTKWKLSGIVDAETDALRVLEPQNCECYYTLDFDKHYYFYVVYPSNENLKPNPDEAGMSNDEALNQIFRDFCVRSYLQSFPGAVNPELNNTYEIHFSGDVDSFEKLLREKNFFENIYRTDYSMIPEFCNIPGGKLSKVRGVNIFFHTVCYIADYKLSTIQFEIDFTPEDSDDGKEYFDALRNVKSFKLEDSELKLYYNDKKKYLLFFKNY